ncbi:hypothetical protein J4447_01690 [Candidatus Pacearchaeota archaeon]|nr:hypothetical protein [Candidatus Pacearchaeota archaeon]
MAVQKKKFFEVEVPLTGEPVELYSYDLESLNGRNMKLDLARLFRGKGVEASFSICLENSKAIAKPRMMKVLPYFIRRAMRKNISYVEDSFSAKCRDAQLRLKPFLITRKEVSRKVRNALRLAARDFLNEYLKDRSSEEIFGDILSSKLPKSLSVRLKKTYPLALCEIRHIEVENVKKE